MLGTSPIKDHCRRQVLILTLGATALLLPRASQAQVCTGMPNPGDFYAGAIFETEPLWGAEVGYGVNPNFGVRARYLWEPPAEDPAVSSERHLASLLSAVEYDLDGWKLCPNAGLELEVRVRSPQNIEIWSIPLGAGVGRVLELSENVSISPFMLPQVVYVTGRPDLDRIGTSTGDTRIVQNGLAQGIDGRLEVGAIVESGRFYGVAVVQVRVGTEELDGTEVEVARPLLLSVGWKF